MYSGFQYCVSIVSIMMFDIIEKVLNSQLNPYISSIIIDDQLHTILQNSILSLQFKL